jgi:hypothetical protein
VQLSVRDVRRAEPRSSRSRARKDREKLSKLRRGYARYRSVCIAAVWNLRRFDGGNVSWSATPGLEAAS